MHNEVKEYFDMPRLLRFKDLNTREFANASDATVGEYYRNLSEFLRIASEVTLALQRFIERDGDKDTYKAVNRAMNLLKDVGCEKFTADFLSLLGAYEKGNWRLSAHFAETSISKFNLFYQPIAAAKRAARPDDAQNGALLLKEYLSRLDEEETKRKLVILAVDDSPVILQSVSSVLSDTYKVYSLPKPTELEKVLMKMVPDLFLLDYLMPEINGFELIPIIRNMKEHAETPIIFLTSEGNVDTLTAALSLGACDFVVKPFSPEVLREKIAKHIVKKKSF